MSPKLSPGLFWSQWVWAVTWFWWARATTWSWWVELPLDSDETDLLPHLPHLMNLSRTWSWWVWPVTWSWWVWFVTCHLVHFKLMTVPLDPDEPELQSNPPNFTKLMSCCLILMSLMSCHLAHLILTILSCRLIYLTSRKWVVIWSWWVWVVTWPTWFWRSWTATWSLMSLSCNLLILSDETEL